MKLVMKKRQQMTMITILLFCLGLGGSFFANAFQTSSSSFAYSQNIILNHPRTHENTPSALYSLLQKEEIIKLNNTSVFERNFGDVITQERSDPFQIQRKDSDETMIFVMMALIFAIGSLSALDRVAMSVALVPMSEEMTFTDTIKGSISSFFSLGYGIGIVPSGLLIANLSPRLIMSVGIFLWSFGTILTPFAAAQANMAILLSARALVGASESCVIPSIQKLLTNWVPSEKKGLAVAIVFAGFQTGTILAYSLSPAVIDTFGDWRFLFYLYGGGGLLFLVPWLALAKDAPQNFDTQKLEKAIVYEDERRDLSDAIDNAKTVITSAPWKGFLQSKGVWAMFLAHAANNWGLYNNLSWTPTFYAEQYNLNVKESAILLVIPSVVGAIGGLSSGVLADKMIANLEVPSDEGVTRVRRIFQGIALFGPSLSLAILSANLEAPWVAEEPWVAQALLTTTVGMQSFNAAGYGAANQEKAGKKWTGLLYSITSLPSVIIGTFSVYLTGRILDATNQDWHLVFGLNSVVFALGATAFVLLYDSKREFD